MLLFPERDGKPRKRKTAPATDRRAQAMAMAICKRQQAAAAWLGRRFSALPHPAQVVCLLLLCLTLGGASGWILAAAVLQEPETSIPFIPSTLPGTEHRQELKHPPDSLRRIDRHDHLPSLK